MRVSQVQSTRLLAAPLAEARPRPQALICASATGFYGSRGDEYLTENSAPGEGFLAGVCRDWEAAAAPAAAAGMIRFALENGALRGPVNAVAPEPVTNLEFTRVLAAVVRRPARHRGAIIERLFPV